MVNPEERTLAILRSDRYDPRAHHINTASLVNKKSFELYSQSLIKSLRDICSNWQNNQSYRLYGEIVPNDVTVLKYEKYSRALDTLSKTMPELVQKILSGEIKISQSNIVLLSVQDARRVRQLLCDNAAEFVGYSDIRKVFPKKPGSWEQQPLSVPAGSVKDMPAYDPDAEISSLVLTIPSWVSSIDRTRSANLSEITEEARTKLKNELLKLKQTVDSMLSAIKEVI